jgi:carboxyl-terminal processing protease
VTFSLKRFRGLLISLSFFITAGVVVAPVASALDCQQVRTLAGVYFKLHFDHHEFDDELSKRTLDSFIKAWDPGKVYFLKADVDGLMKKYATKLDDMILDANCKVIDEVVSLYSKRFQERQAAVTKLIDAKHDFTVDEYMAIDRKKMEYATTTEEVTERWRKRIKFQMLQLNGTIKDLAKTREKLHKRYDLLTKRHNEMTSDDVYAIFLNSFSSSLDPHSEYMAPEQLEDFRISTRLSLEGIGAVLRSEEGFTTIQSLVPGGAAAKTGKVKTDDKIIAVAQGAEAPVDVIDMDLREVVKMIRGTRGTEVRLTLVREESGKTTQLIVPIIREQVQLKDRAAKSTVYPVSVEEGKDKPSKQFKIGVIELPSFYMDFEGRQNREKDFKSSSEDMKNEINKLKKQSVDAIVVDLRSNGGGSLDESITIAGLFFDEGPVVQTKDTRGMTFISKDEDPKTYYNGPLIVLINRQSASASEIFAGAIQDYGRGLIVGDTHSFGKGTVQNLNDLDPKLGAIKVTISKFYRPSGSSTQLRGVASDIILPDLLDQYEIGEKHYDYALPWEKIPASSFKKFNQVQPYVKQLADASKVRVEKDPGFAKVFEAIKEYKSSEKERSQVSLKEGKDEELAAEKAAKEGKKDGKKDVAKKDDKKKKAEEDDEEIDHLPIQEDYQLQETLRIAGDYMQLLNKKPLAKVSLPSLDVAVVAQGAAKKADDTKSRP